MFGVYNVYHTKCKMCCAHPSIVDNEWCKACGSILQSHLSTCPECRGNDIVTDMASGNMVCTGCGRVVESCIIDDAPEWMNGDEPGVDKSRCGPSQTGDLLQSSTIMLDVRRSNKDVRSIQKYHQQMGMDYQQRALHAVFKEISSVCAALHIPEVVIFQAKEMYKDLKQVRISRGMVHRALIASCVYYACKVQRQEGLQRSRIVVAEAFGVDEKAMTSACKLFKVTTVGRPYHAALYDTMHTNDLVHRVMGTFQFPRDTRILVMRSVRTLDDALRTSGALDGKSPCSILAAVLCIVFEKLDMDIPKKTIAERCDTSIVTLNKMLTFLKPSC